MPNGRTGSFGVRREHLLKVLRELPIDGKVGRFPRPGKSQNVIVSHIVRRVEASTEEGFFVEENYGGELYIHFGTSPSEWLIVSEDDLLYKPLVHYWNEQVREGYGRLPPEQTR